MPIQALDIREGMRFADLTDFEIKTLPISSVSVSTAIAQKYRMRGYRVAAGQYEYWITTDPTAPPPSGNTLVAISVEATLPSTA